MKTVSPYIIAVSWRTAVRLLLVLALLVALSATVGTSLGSAQPTGTDAPVAPAQGEKIIYVDWNITASGNSTTFIGTTKRMVRHHIVIRGSTVIHQTPGEYFVKAVPFDLTVTDDWEAIETGLCRYTRTHRYITDPARYTGGPDEFWIYPQIFQPRQRADGRWYIEDPFKHEFYTNGDLARNFTYRFDSLDEDCSSSDFHTWTQEFVYYITVFGLQPRDLEGDPTGTVFTRDETYTLEPGDPPLTVNFHATVRLPCGAAAASAAGSQSPNQQVCGCAAYPESHVFDASDPVVNSLDVKVIHGPALVQPDDTDSITFHLWGFLRGETGQERRVGGHRQTGRD